MVYRGKPSKACIGCRRRKLPCDLIRPACGQCVRAHLLCEGYRDVDRLRVVDESHVTAQKSQARATQPAAKLNTSLSPSLQTRARVEFYDYYVEGAARTYRFLSNLESQSPLDAHLDTAIDAVSLAFSFSRIPSPELLRQARWKYGIALQLTSTALENTNSVRTNSTLTAALLLDLFEKIVNSQAALERSWKSHIEGALVLVQLRGQQQFDDDLSLSILRSLATKLVISCLVSATRVPEGLMALRARLASNTIIYTPKFRLTGLMVKYANLRAAVNDDDMNDIAKRTAFQKLDTEFIELSQMNSPDWTYQIEIKTTTFVPTHEGYYHLYPEFHIAQTWNVLRMTRIIFNEEIYKSIADPNLTNTELVSNYADIIHEIEVLCSEICASAPLFLEALNTLLSNNQNSPPQETHKVQSQDPYSLDIAVLSLQCQTLMLPFYIAANSFACPPQTRDWIMNTLTKMADRFRMKNAAVVLGLLRDEQEHDPWDVYARLGTYAFSI